MATKDETQRACIDDIKIALRSTTTCSNTTVSKLKELLLDRSEGDSQKENVKISVKATARRRAGTTQTAAAVEISKHVPVALSPRNKYVLATETANISLKCLADTLKIMSKPARAHKVAVSTRSTSPPAPPLKSHTSSVSVSQNPLRERSASQTTNSPQKRIVRQSTSHTSFAVSGPDSGLVAVAECARISFAYLSSSQAEKVAGKDVQPLQLETGILALIGKLMALGLDSHALKEMRVLKRRLEKHLGLQPNMIGGRETSQGAKREKETLASLLVFEDINSSNHAVPLVVQLQLYALRLIAKLKNPKTIDACWDHVKLSNPTAPANLIIHQMELSQASEKAARQLESLAQTILSLCPSISSTTDNEKMLASPDIALPLQHLALKIRTSWWSLAKHQPNFQEELLQPFTKCLTAYARRSKSSPGRKYELAVSLYTDLVGKQSNINSHESTSAAHKTLSALAQAAGHADEALQWLGIANEEPTSAASAAKEAARLVRIATMSIEAFLKGDRERELVIIIDRALNALKGSLGGSSSDLDEVFLETNGLRRSATRLLLTQRSVDNSPHSELYLSGIALIASTVRFTARFVVARVPSETNKKLCEKHNEPLDMVWKIIRSLIDSACATCKAVVNITETWKELDTQFQECSHILRHLEAHIENQLDEAQKRELLSSSNVRLSGAYWNMHILLRKANADVEIFVLAIQRSIDLIALSSKADQESGLISVKYEHMGDALDRVNQAEASRRAYHACIKSHLKLQDQNILVEHTACNSLTHLFRSKGPFAGMVRVLQSYHHSFIKFGSRGPDETAFYDDIELDPAVRGALLEYQLAMYIRSLARNRPWHSSLNKSVFLITQRLQEVYSPKTYPLRHLRALTALLQLSQTYPRITIQEQPFWDTSMPVHRQLAGSNDEGLMQLEAHITALFQLKTCMQREAPSSSNIQRCLTIWENIVEQSKSIGDVEERVDDLEVLIQELECLSEFLNTRGLEYIALPAFQLLDKLHGLQRDVNADQHITATYQLGLQWLRLGYTGEARSSFTKAEALLKDLKCSVETNLKWSIAYSEYLLAIGDTENCASVLSAAKAMAAIDDDFMSLSKPSVTLSKRTRFNRVLADAAHVYSLLDLATGSHKSALRNARQCVTLNRRIWAGIESSSKEKQAKLIDEADMSIEGTNSSTFDPLSSVRNDKGVPLVMSVTHEVLGGADFWSLTPALYRALMQHSQVLASQGQLHEAMYVAEQAEKVAAASKSPTFIADNASWRADCWARSGRLDKARTILNAVKSHSERQCVSTIGYYTAVARVHHHAGDYEDEIETYDKIEALIHHLRSPTFIQSLTGRASDVDSLSETLSKVILAEPEPRKVEPPAGARGRKATGKGPTRAPTKKTARSRAPPTSSKVTADSRVPSKPLDKVQANVNSQYHTLEHIWETVLDRKVIATALQKNWKSATTLLDQIEKSQGNGEGHCLLKYAAYKTLFAQGIEQIAEDITVNSLTESTIAFPATSDTEGSLNGDPTEKSTAVSNAKPAKAKALKKAVTMSFIETLQEARKRLLDARTQTYMNGPNDLFRQISVALGQLTVLLSAVAHGSGDLLRPSCAAFMNETAKCNSLRLLRGSVEVDTENVSREESLRWPSQIVSTFELPSTAEFQRDYVDIIPRNWGVVSLSLNEARDELHVTRFESGSTPFLLRLPLARDTLRDIDDTGYSFDDGKRDLDMIMELNDFSTRSAQDMTSKSARQQWWDERAALDDRLLSLLQNIENIWLGGFKGVFSQHEKRPTLLGRFREALETVLNSHLPSRRKRTQQRRAILHSQVLELFIGLGDARDSELDMDDSLMDLLYFVVDILHFNGERNAYDEIDFDKMVVETHDALQAYHSASCKSAGSSPHTVLILDNNLHAFPWESLPFMENISISRLPSLAALRERLLASRQSTKTPDRVGHYVTAAKGGTSILNPSGDLKHTLRTLQPCLNELQGPWSHITNRAPTETEFEDSLREKELVLYFGHGSGAQYIRSKTIHRLFTRGQKSESDDIKQPNCATTLLFGCSSVHLTENGVYEPSGMLASYLVAGAPAVVGMLWDVTDKDCDRFAVRTGELWGLWPEQPGENTASMASMTKTPGRNGKGKGKAAQSGDEVEAARGAEASTRKRGRKVKTQVDESASPSPSRTGYSLDEAVRDARSACKLRYLNGAAAVVYGIPVYLE